MFQYKQGRVSQVIPHCDAGVIPRADAESSKQLGILDSASARGMTDSETRPLWSIQLGSLRIFIKTMHGSRVGDA